jgi:hypothetical protein
MAHPIHRSSVLTETGLYIEPCTYCPLQCTLCYTAHEKQKLLDERWILRAVDLYAQALDTVGVFWCGLGEVLYDRRFAPLLQRLDDRYGARLVHVIQTSGQLPEHPILHRPEHRFFAVSIDLPVRFNEQHRGAGYTAKAETFIAQALKNGALGVQIKCLLTLATIAAVPNAFRALQARIADQTGLSQSTVETKLTLEPILPFAQKEVAQISSPAFIAQGGAESRQALLAAVAKHLPEHLKRLTTRPRTVELALTADGLFNCCEAVESIGTLRDLDRLDYAQIIERLQASMLRCEDCVLRDVC